MLIFMKYRLINLYYDLKFTLPARTYEAGARTRKNLERLENILWSRYGYDIALKHTFKLL